MPGAHVDEQEGEGEQLPLPTPHGSSITNGGGLEAAEKQDPDPSTEGRASRGKAGVEVTV